jgi:RNA polymerase sigma-70 factor, ECF subfamily
VTTDDQTGLAGRFEEHRPRLRAVAYRLLGSMSDADDAVQDAWLRLARIDAESVENLGAWLTTVVARVALNMLRSRRTRREEPLELRLPDPVVDRPDGVDPAHETLLADGVGLALLVVLETLTPAERVAFVLHDSFAVPFDEIARILDRSPDSARQLASRARRRVRGAPTPDPDPSVQWRAVDAFLAAAREGNFEALMAVLDPDVVLRADTGGGVEEVRGAADVAGRALMWQRVELSVHRALINGLPGLVSLRAGRPFSVGAFTAVDGRVVEIDIVADRDRLAALDVRAIVP